MKKVLIFSLAYFPKHVGGAEVSIKEITDRITDIEFHMITNRFDSTLAKEEKVGNVLVHRIGIARPNPTMAELRKWPLHLNKALYQFTAVWHAWRLNRTYQYDATWAMMAHSCGVPAGLFKMLSPRTKYILNLQEGDPPEYIEKTMWPLWPLFKRAFTSADMVQCLSTFLASWSRRMGYMGETVVVPNAVSAKHFSQTYQPAVLDEIKDKLGKSMGDVFLITTSRLVKKNAVDDVVRALPLLPPNVHFAVAGTGPDEEILKKLVRDNSLEGRVHFLGHLGHDEMPKYLQACDIFIRPSRSEGFGASFAEAMAAGLPVIATQEGGLSDFLFDEKRNPDKPITGWAVDKDSPEQIAAAVKAIMTNPEKVRAVVRTAREMVNEKYDWDIIARDMRTKVLGKVLAE